MIKVRVDHGLGHTLRVLTERINSYVQFYGRFFDDSCWNKIR